MTRRGGCRSIDVEPDPMHLDSSVPRRLVDFREELCEGADPHPVGKCRSQRIALSQNLAVPCEEPRAACLGCLGQMRGVGVMLAGSAVAPQNRSDPDAIDLLTGRQGEPGSRLGCAARRPDILGRVQVKHLVDDATWPEQVDASAVCERPQALDQPILFEPRAIEDVGVESDEQDADLIGGKDRDDPTGVRRKRRRFPLRPRPERPRP